MNKKMAPTKIDKKCEKLKIKKTAQIDTLPPRHQVTPEGDIST